jgi:uncharacterized protein YdeI (YjbR/CyaY-like superfamily)
LRYGRRACVNAARVIVTVNKKETQLPIIAFPDGKAFAAWIEQQKGDCAGLWVKFAKKASGIASISQQEALDVALCYGWIDGQRTGFDTNYYLNRYTPRRARSKWSEINRVRALGLIDEGRMRSGGLAEVERAKADGRWDAALAPPSKWTVPDDLLEALAQNAPAKALFSQLDSQNRVAILLRIQDAKKAETRAARIEKYVGMLARGETPYPRRKARVVRKS